MSYEQILYTVADRVATITLNRPDKLNAWTPQMEKEVREALAGAEGDANVRVIVLTGAGRGFCAGADMKALESMAGGQRDVAAYEKALKERGTGSRTDTRADFQKTYSYFLGVRKPIIGALNGSTVGLGLVISLYCDIRFASDQAKFGTAFARRGLAAEHGLSWMLPRLVGISNAMDLLYSARIIDAAEALRMGLVSRMLPADQFMDGVRAYAKELATMVSPRSMAVIKKQVYDGLFQTLAEAYDSDVAEMIKCFGTEDFKEGVAHFVEKRPPAFTGK